MDKIRWGAHHAHSSINHFTTGQETPSTSFESSAIICLFSRQGLPVPSLLGSSENARSWQASKAVSCPTNRTNTRECENSSKSLLVGIISCPPLDSWVSARLQKAFKQSCRGPRDAERIAPSFSEESPALSCPHIRSDLQLLTWKLHIIWLKTTTTTTR